MKTPDKYEPRSGLYLVLILVVKAFYIPKLQKYSHNGFAMGCTGLPTLMSDAPLGRRDDSKWIALDTLMPGH